MDTSRRRFLAGASVALSGSLAGCLDTVTGDLEFSATGATVTDPVLAQTNYSLYQRREETVTRQVGVGPVTRTVRAHNVVTEYDQGISLLGQRLQAAVFAVLSTPQVEVLGRTFNPVGDMTTDDLAETVQSRYEGIGNVSGGVDREGSLLGETTTLTRYTADAQLASTGVSVEIYLYVTTAVTAGSDYVLALAGHPVAAGAREARVRTLLGGVTHPDSA